MDRKGGRGGEGEGRGSGWAERHAGRQQTHKTQHRHTDTDTQKDATANKQTNKQTSKQTCACGCACACGGLQDGAAVADARVRGPRGRGRGATHVVVLVRAWRDNLRHEPAASGACTRGEGPAVMGKEVTPGGVMALGCMYEWCV